MDFSLTSHNTFLRLTTWVMGMLVVALIPFVASAQFAQQSDNVSLQLSTETPSPEESMTASVSGFGVDMSRASIIWFIDGRQVVSGIGETRISFDAPPLGESMTVRVAINPNTASSIEKSRTITPSQIDLLWEAVDAYAPPFYKGKALPASQGIIRVVAVPHLVTPGRGVANSESVLYRWKRNFRYRDFSNLSGYGARTITYRKNMLDDTDRITVEVSSLGGDLSGASTVVVPALTPTVLFYENHPLYGVLYNRAFNDRFDLTTQESTIVAEPYFFSVKTPEELSYTWKASGEEVPTEDEDRANALTLRTEGGSGEVSFSLSVTHPNYILQLLNTSLNIVFGEESTGGQRSPFSL